MKILFAPAHYYLSDKYGSEPYWAYQIVKKSIEFGHDVTIIVGIYDCNRTFDKNTKVYVAFPKGRSSHVILEAWKRLYFIFFVYFKTQSILRKEKFDIIHHVLPCSLDTFSFLGLFKNKTIPFIMGPLQRTTSVGGAQSFNRTFGKNHLTFSSVLMYLVYKIIRPFVTFLSLQTFYKADAVIFPSQDSRQFYNSLIPHIKKKYVIPIGIDLTKGIKQSKKGKAITFLSVGYLTKRKGHIVLLKAFKKLIQHNASVRLSIVGNGPEFDTLKTYIKNNTLEKSVDLIGFISPKIIQTLYQKADVFVLPSLEDSFPTVVLEAMSYGLPLIATDTGSVAEMVERAGIMAKSGDTSSLYKAILELYSFPQRRQLLSQNARKQVKKYVWSDIIKKYASIYKDLHKKYI